MRPRASSSSASASTRTRRPTRRFLQRSSPAFLTAREFKIHEDYGTFMYPETYIIDSQGKVLKKIAEPVDWIDPA